MDLIYRKEKTLFSIMLVISIIVWLLVLIGTVGGALVYLLGFFIFYCFAQSALISYLKGTGVRISQNQFPDLHERIQACCAKLELTAVPEAYLLHMGGAFNAFATRFLGKNFIVLYSDIVDALDDNPDALNFYIGHEVGHLKRKHLHWGPVLAPAAVLPLIGAAYSRAREYTCDRHGLRACNDANNAQFGLAALAAGGKRWRSMSKSSYIQQASESGGFWMSLHELTSDYPWLVKRMAAVRALAAGKPVEQPRRHPLAVLLALFVPRIGLGAGLAPVMVMVAIVGMLAAVALPAYQAYAVRSQLLTVMPIAQKSTAAISEHYMTNGRIPRTLEDAGLSSTPREGNIAKMTINQENGVLSVFLADGKALLFTPSLTDRKTLAWKCSSEDIPADHLPRSCR